MWYYFSVSGAKAGEKIVVRIMNLNPAAKIYNRDLRPLVRVPTRSSRWERLAQWCTFHVTPALELQLSFEYTFLEASPGDVAGAGEGATAFFAFYYPFSYSDNQRLLDNLDRALAPSAAASAP